ncbi:hypothetical protein DFJ74DRAFT_650162 [Hyaloraphidium curvatum]|nr:hypothetical protein DFJ74DRAFT_650162 [Hyaloraphidium curvatum]
MRARLRRRHVRSAPARRRLRTGGDILRRDALRSFRGPGDAFVRPFPRRVPDRGRGGAHLAEGEREAWAVADLPPHGQPGRVRSPARVDALRAGMGRQCVGHCPRPHRRRRRMHVCCLTLLRRAAGHRHSLPIGRFGGTHHPDAGLVGLAGLDAASLPPAGLDPRVEHLACGQLLYRFAPLHARAIRLSDAGEYAVQAGRPRSTTSRPSLPRRLLGPRKAGRPRRAGFRCTEGSLGLAGRAVHAAPRRVAATVAAIRAVVQHPLYLPRIHHPHDTHDGRQHRG